MRRALKIAGIVSTLIVLIFLAVGFTTPFDDREGKCTICGMMVFQKTSDRFDEPFLILRDTDFSRYYQSSGFPDHEHNWEFLGGVTRTNLFSFPGKYEFERSDEFLLVKDDFLIGIMERLPDTESRLNLLRAINCDDLKIRKEVRKEIASRYPNGMGGFMEWWKKYSERIKKFESSIISPR